MFNFNERFLVCNMANFTLGIDISVFEKGTMLTKTTATSKEEAMSMIYDLCEIQSINNIFIQPLAPTNINKTIEEIKAYGKINFSKIVDNIHFHVI